MLTRPLFRPLARPLTRGVLDSPWGDNPTLDLNFASGSMPSGLTFTRSSSGTYFDADGVMQTAAVDQPRIVYEGGSCRGLLIEEQRTNMVLNSATLATQSVAVTAQAYTLSFYGTGTVTLSGAATNSLVGTGASNRVSLTFTPSAGTLTLTVSGSVTKAQLEAGSFATSYIPTSGTAVTRAADSCSRSTGAWYSATQGTLYTESFLVAGVPSGAIGLVVFNDGTSSNQLGVRYDTGGQVAAAVAFSAGVNQTTLSPLVSGDARSKTIKLVHAWSPDGRAALGSGGTLKTQAGFTPPAVDRLSIGGYPSATALNGTIARVRYWNKRLPDAKLVSLTT